MASLGRITTHDREVVEGVLLFNPSMVISHSLNPM